MSHNCASRDYDRGEAFVRNSIEELHKALEIKGCDPHVEGNEVQPDLPFQLSGSQRKTARAIEINVDRMISEAGIEMVGFLTLTVGESRGENFVQVRDAAEASKRIHTLARRFLPSLFERWVIVTERHKSGAIHFHLIVQTRGAIREQFDWAAVRAGDYSSACPALRRIWALLRAELPSFGFGRAQLEPLKNGEAASRYVAKYVEKNLFNRLAEDHRKKLVRYGGWEGKHCRSNDIAWVGARAAAWRHNARTCASLVGAQHSTVARFFGPRWAYRLSRAMNAIRGNDQTRIDFRNWPEREAARRIVMEETNQRALVMWHENARTNNDPRWHTEGMAAA